jgi:biotin transport system substrate-specific component
MIPGAVVTGWLATLCANSDKPHAASSARGALEGAQRWQVARYTLAAILGGIVVVYAVGIPWLAVVAKMDFIKACWAMLVFLPGDMLKAIVAAVVAQRIRRLNMV